MMMAISWQSKKTDVRHVCRSIAEKGPTTDEKLATLEVTISNYEAKVKLWRPDMIILWIESIKMDGNRHLISAYWSKN